MTTHALMELADRLRREARMIEANNETKPRPSAYGRKMVSLLNEAATQLRTAAAEGVESVGVLDRSMPPKIWLQIDPNGDEKQRNYPVGESSWSEISWCAESVGGQEVLYIRHDLARASPPTDSGAGRDGTTLAEITDAFNIEIARVSTLEFNSNEVCRAFYRNLMKRINPDWDPAIAGAAGE